MKTIDQRIFTSEAVSNETTVGSTADIQHCWGYSVYLSYTGSTLSGTAKLQASHDGSTWFDLANSGATAQHTLGASGGSNHWNVDGAYYPYVRLSVTTDDANTATCNAWIFAKGV